MSCENCEESAYVIDKLAKLLAEIAVIVNGVEPHYTSWSYHDLPEKVRALKQPQQPAALAVPATMADGWRHDICATLNRVMPSWIAAGKTPIEAACNAIEALAAVACEAHDKPAAAVPEGDKLTDTDVFTLIGDAHVRRGRGEDDLPSYELDLARRIAVALGDRALAERCEELAAAERKGE